MLVSNLFTRLALLGALITFGTFSLMATCSIGTNISDGYFVLGGGNNQYVSQQITACENGPISELSFSAKSHGYEALNTEIRIVEGTNIAQGGGTLLGSLDISPMTFGVDETFTFTPSNTFQLVKGTTYTFWLELNITFKNSGPSGTSQGRSGGMEFSRNSAATEENVGEANSGIFGRSRTNQASGRMVQALTFRATLQAPATDAEEMEPIPTMSEWGLLIFGLLILNLGVFYVLQMAKSLPR